VSSDDRITGMDSPYLDNDDASHHEEGEDALRQAEVDSGFFMPTSPNNRPVPVPATDAAVIPNAAQMNFYRRRRLSDTSIDSSQGFIDHRQQSYSQSRQHIPNSGLSRSRPGAVYRHHSLHASEDADPQRTGSWESLF
jgi:hypothetical protein